MLRFPEPSPLPPRRLFLTGVVLAALSPLLLPVDAAIVRLLNPAIPGPTDAVLRFLHETMPVLILSVAVVVGGSFWIAGRTASLRRGGLLLVVAPFLANRITGILKGIIERARPQHPGNGIEGLRVLIAQVDLESFPSGHVTTAAAFAFAAFAILPYRAAAALAVILVPAMMWDRVALAAHFPADVVAGAAIAALTVGVMSALVAGRDPRLAPKWRVPVAALGILCLTAAWPKPVFPLDPVTLYPNEGFALLPTSWRTMFEPFVGPALEVAYAPDPRGCVARLAPWAAAAFGALLFLPRRSPFRARRRRTVVLAAWMIVVMILGWRGDLPADRFTAPAGASGVFFDPHVHAGDPVDGSMGLPRMLARATARGIGVVAATNHDAPPPTVDAIPGTEWSGGRHPAQPFLHLLILGGDGAIAAANAREVPALDPADGPARTMALEVIREAKSKGAVVIVAHWWRTHRLLRRAGLDRHLPSPEELADAGADGFEIANRHWDADPGDRAEVAAIDEICRERKLLRLSSSDDHGRPAGSPCITFLPGVFPGDPSGRRAAVLDHLRRRGSTIPLVFHRERRAQVPRAFLAGPVFAWRYLVSLSPAARISALLWFLVLWRISAIPGGSPARSPASSRR